MQSTTGRQTMPRGNTYRFKILTESQAANTWSGRIRYRDWPRVESGGRSQTDRKQFAEIAASKSGNLILCAADIIGNQIWRQSKAILTRSRLPAMRGKVSENELLVEKSTFYRHFELAGRRTIQRAAENFLSESRHYVERLSLQQVPFVQSICGPLRLSESRLALADLSGRLRPKVSSGLRNTCDSSYCRHPPPSPTAPSLGSSHKRPRVSPFQRVCRSG